MQWGWERDGLTLNVVLRGRIGREGIWVKIYAFTSRRNHNDEDDEDDEDDGNEIRQEDRRRDKMDLEVRWTNSSRHTEETSEGISSIWLWDKRDCRGFDKPPQQ